MSASVDDWRFTIGNAQVTEGGTLRFPVTYDGTDTAVVYLGTEGGAPSAGTFDYTPASTSLQFDAPGTQYFDVSTSQDNRSEWDEIVLGKIMDTYAAGGDPGGEGDTGNGKILNDDQTVITWTTTGWDNLEGDVATPGSVKIVGTLSNPTEIPVSIPYETDDIDGGATSGVDYVATAGSVSVPVSGYMNETVTFDALIPLLGDERIEEDQIFNVTFQPAVVQGIIEYGSGTNPAPRLTVDQNTKVVAITDDDTGYVLMTSIARDVGEGDGSIAVGVRFVGDSEVGGFTVDAGLTSGATANPASATGGDYNLLTSGQQHLHFDGTDLQTQTVTITVNDDNVVENPEEDFLVQISNVQMDQYWLGLTSISVNATAHTTTVDIIDNDTAILSLSGNQSVWEEGFFNTGPQTLTFTVSLSNPIDEAITVTYQVSGIGPNPVTLAGAAGADVTVAGGAHTVVIPRGATSATFTITTVADTTVEVDELLRLSLLSWAFTTTGAGTRDISLGGNTISDVTIRSNE